MNISSMYWLPLSLLRFQPQQSSNSVFANINSMDWNPVSVLRFQPKQSSKSSFAQEVNETRQTSETRNRSKKSTQMYLDVPEDRRLTCCSAIGAENYGQGVYGWYTEDSTEEDPIVQIAGVCKTGHYEFVRHINDINPANASYAELAVLFDHLSVTGQVTKRPGSSSGHVLPNGIESGDVMQKRNYLRLIQNHTTSRWFSPDIRSSARDLVDTYSRFMESKGNQTGQKSDLLQMTTTDYLLQRDTVKK